MMENEMESLAKRYIRYLGVESRTENVCKPFNVSIGGFLFISYAGFLFGENVIPGPDGFREKSYNELVTSLSDWTSAHVIEYSSTEELDFKLSAMGF